MLKELAERKDVHFNIGPPMFFHYYEDALIFRNTRALLAQAGRSVSLRTDALGGNQQNLLHLAALCVRYGMKEEDALRAVTLAPAEAAELAARGIPVILGPASQAGLRLETTQARSDAALLLSPTSKW